MNERSSPGGYRPFRNLRKLIDQRRLTIRTDHVRPPAAESDSDTETCLFENAMKGVTRLASDTKFVDSIETIPEPVSEKLDTEEGLQHLHRLVNKGEGFVVAQTPEYREGVGCNVHPAIAQHLHGGRFAVQSHIDLHGLSVAEAREVFDTYLQTSIRNGQRMVLVVHGRGLSSPAIPVLKTKVHEWLKSGPWRKWVLAFASARSCDGGAGATYVLLRGRPLTRRNRRQPRSRLK
jgi:DNA-nicking Smr family endonuclease